MSWLDRLPLPWVVALAVWMAVAPITPEPHLIEKLRMLFSGTLTRPLDVFDLANNRYRGEALLWIGQLPFGENHAPTLYLAFDGTE